MLYFSLATLFMISFSVASVKKIWDLSMGQNDICAFSLASAEECVA